MILEEEALYNAKLKQYIKKKMEAILIRFPKKDKVYILDELLRWVHNFVILDSDELELSVRVPVRRVCCEKTDCQRVMKMLASNQTEKQEEFRKDLNSDDYQYIFFIREIGRDLRDDVDKNKIDASLREYKFNIMKHGMKQYNIQTTYFYNRYLVIEMTKEARCSEENILVYENGKKMKQSYILSTLGGLGDWFILFSVFYEYVRIMKLQGIEVYFAIMDWNDSEEGYDNFFMQDQPKLIIDNIAMRDFYKLRETRNLVDLNHCFTKSGKPEHIINLVKEMLRIDQRINPYKHSKVLMSRLIDVITNEEMEYINQLAKTKNLIGCQYFTGRFDSEMQTYSVNSTRNWSYENVKAFVKKCKENGFEVIALNPNPYQKDIGAIQLRTITYPAYAMMISKLKLMVGIDSSGGHIASFFGIPSITIWGRQSPLDAFGKNVGYRVLRKNYSIWSSDKDINSITSDVVYEHVQNFFSGKLKFSDDYITYENSQKGYFWQILEE